jgi:hypothetical protein
MAQKSNRALLEQDLADGPINAAQTTAGHRPTEKSRQSWSAPRRTEREKIIGGNENKSTEKYTGSRKMTELNSTETPAACKKLGTDTVGGLRSEQELRGENRIGNSVK